MKKKIMSYSLFLTLMTGCAAEEAENKVTLAQMTENKEHNSPQKLEPTNGVQNKPLGEAVEQEQVKEEHIEKQEPVEQEQEQEPESKKTQGKSKKIASTIENKKEQPFIEQTDGEKNKTTNDQQPQQNPQSEQEKWKASLKNYLTWDGFFENGDQTTPSEKFWDLKGQQVMIDGFMGEILSLDGGWFLLIPAPGAECPFDNGNESYWNKIMIVFVKDKKDLRFTTGPLRLKGRLDVGIKVDESNYKTMFRLYDATLERMN